MNVTESVSTSTPASVTANATTDDVATASQEVWADPEPDVFMLVGFTLISIVGILGNTLVIVVIGSSKRMVRKIINLYFMHQSIVDLFACFMLLVTGVCKYLTGPDFLGLKGVAATVYCRVIYVELLLWAALNTSTYNLLCLTFERYLEIVKPIWHKIHFTRKVAKVTMVSVWVGCFTYTFADTIPTSNMVDGQCYFNDYTSTLAGSVASVFNVTLTYFIPVIIITGCYASIAISLRTRVGLDPDDRRSQFMARARKNTLKTLFVVLGCYLFCWTYAEVPFVMSRFNKLDYSFWTTPWGYLATMTPVLNCIVNPFIYTIQYRDFQISLRKLLGWSVLQVTDASMTDPSVAPTVTSRVMAKETPS